jgi:hypothetical protein
VKVRPHPYFKRENYDIYTANQINISQAVLGGNIKVKTLYGDVNVYVDPGTNDGDTKKLLNYVCLVNNLGNNQTSTKPTSERKPFRQVQAEDSCKGKNEGTFEETLRRNC